jgi:hypothetical protein
MRYTVGFCDGQFSNNQTIKEQSKKYTFNLMFCLPTSSITVYQYRETKVMNVLISLLRIKDIYMFLTLLAHPQGMLHKRHLVYCVRVTSIGCARVGASFHLWRSQPT